MASALLLEKRNVVVVGKVGAGKSTICKIITDSDKFVVSSGLDSKTQNIMHEELKFTEAGTEYTFKVVDTTGLFDPGNPRRSTVANKIALKNVQSYARRHIEDGVSIVLFVFRKGRFTPEEGRTFRALFKNLAEELSAISALVITECENDNETSRSELVHDFRTNPLTADIAKRMGKGIHPVGFPDISKLRPVLKDAYQAGIEADRDTLMCLIKDSRELRLCKELFQEALWEGIREATCFSSKED